MEKREDKGCAIEIRDLVKSYGKNRGADGISLEVEEGDIFGFLGPNGAGKSTVIRCMLGILRSFEGEIRILSLDGRKQSKEILSQVGYMPSEAMFYPSMKVKDVIRFAAEARGLDCGKEAERICGLLEINTEKRIRELSLGNRKKVSIVCAMQHKPRLLVMDEPTSGLDPLMQEAFFELICEYNRKGTTCFLSSHVLSEVKKYCRNAAFVKSGKVIRMDSVENLSKSGLRRIRIWTQGKERQFDYNGEIRGLLPELAKMGPEDVLIEEPPLDELFMHYYEEGNERDTVKA